MTSKLPSPFIRRNRKIFLGFNEIHVVEFAKAIHWLFRVL
jgi:hypothetical protein